MMKNILKKTLDKFGIVLNLKKNLWYLNSFEIQKKLVAKNDPIIFDIGACDGSTIIEYNKYFADPIIYAFEPFPESFKKLKNFTNSMNNVHAIQMALSDVN